MRADTTVRLLDLSSDATGREEWRGTLADFEASNGFSDDERALIHSSLDTLGMHAFGGGAEPITVLEVVAVAGPDLYLLTAKGLIHLTGNTAARVMSLFDIRYRPSLPLSFDFFIPRPLDFAQIVTPIVGSDRPAA